LRAEAACASCDKSTPAIVVADAIGGQYLDGDLTVEPWIAGAIDLAHPAFAKFRLDAIRAE